MFRDALKVEGLDPARTNAMKTKSASSSSILPVIIAKNAINSIRISGTVSVEVFSGEGALFLLFVLLSMVNPFCEKNIATRTAFL